ncbi:VOC family protein [candidate division WWE3 bacterium]|uniref:VOC family protein n=1 Tax=candidate division WWE3 bacterium TaxID=2053526 RepID=A0A955LGE0_UNCKA|nr:VOC family protein [candidate division WWE3 bacterium]
MMNQDPISGYRILIWSEDPDKLQTFYRDVLALEPFIKLDIPDDYGYAFKVGDSGLLIWIGKHSEVHGENKDPQRHIFNLYVHDVQAWYEKIKDRNDVTILQEPMVTPPTRDADIKKYVCTFLDPEGNCFQFMNP